MTEANKEVENNPTLALRLAGIAISKYSQSPGILKDARKIYDENAFYKVILNNSYPVIAVAFSPDGKTVLTGSGVGDNTVRLCDLTGKPIGKTMMHKDLVTAVAFSPDGKTILSGSWDKTARLWDLAGNPIGEVMQHSSMIDAVAFSPDGKTVLTCSWDKTARLWDLNGNPVGELPI